jgi:PKD repeat protein
MKKGINKFSRPALLVLMMVFGLTVMSQTYHKDYSDGRIYLKFKDNVQVNIPVNEDKSVDLDKAPFLAPVRQQFDVRAMYRPYDVNNDFKLLRTFELHFGQFDQVEEIMSELMKNPDLEYAERVPIHYISYTPNDSLYNREYMSSNWNWHLDVISAEMAWDVTKGSSEIRVAIVDNAVWVDHPDLENKIVISEDVTQPGVQNSNPPGSGDAAAWSHGTHCAGLAAAETDNLIGVAGVGYNVSLMGVKCSSNNPNSISNGFSGINWAANNGANVISCSWGGGGSSTTEQNMINTVWGMGIVVVAAAGNDNVSTPHYPSAYNHVISVASTNENDVKTDFSNYGVTVDVCAPGGYGISGPSGLMSSTYEYTNAYGYYNTYFGTSMACPVAAGLCGLIFSVNPDLTPDELEEVLESTCDDIYSVPGNENYLGKLGAGRINAHAAVANTPFDPVADFYTPIPYITPGTAVQFFDQSAGVPDSWSWEFVGGQPYLSGQPNPAVTYNNEGVFTVYLGVANDHGSDVVTKTGYVTVTSTPIPWVVFSSDNTSVCNMETVAFTDESLYNPTGWNWQISPNTFSFVDGTSNTSQNPHVMFEAPGNYTVTLNATNANGSNSKTIENMISVEGIGLNFTEDFESAESMYFELTHNDRGKIKVDTRAAAPGSTNGLHFQGFHMTGGWTGGPANTTPDQAWNVNTNFHAFASNCNIDATGIAGVGLSFDLRQTFSIGNKYSWLRVLVNDEQVSDINGTADFNPVTNTDPWATKVFDLSGHGNSMFSLTFQSACYLQDKFYAEGDNVFVDNIMISNTTGLLDGNHEAGVLTYPNPANTVLNFSANGTGSNITVKVMNLQGQTISEKNISGYRDGDVYQVKTAVLSNGIYILQISGDQGMVVKKFVKE